MRALGFLQHNTAHTEHVAACVCVCVSVSVCLCLCVCVHLFHPPTGTNIHTLSHFDHQRPTSSPVPSNKPQSCSATQKRRQRKQMSSTHELTALPCRRECGNVPFPPKPHGACGCGKDAPTSMGDSRKCLIQAEHSCVHACNIAIKKEEQQQDGTWACLPLPGCPFLLSFPPSANPEPTRSKKETTTKRRSPGQSPWQFPVFEGKD